MKKQLWICCFVLCMLFCHSLSAVEIKWLDADTPAVMPGVTWGMPWARGTVRVEKFTGRIDTVTVEQRGPIRAVVKFEGRHAGPNGRAWLPFVVRVYFYAGSDAVRMMHTMIYDGDESKDFIRGLGVRFDVPMKDALHDRHIRFVGD